MKRLLLVILITLAAQARSLAQPQFSADAPEQSIGELVFQKPNDIRFRFRNRGNQPLIIREVHPSCGCVSVDYPTTPIAPGHEGTIVATYDARLLGTFHRELTVYTNVRQQPYYLSFEGRVVATSLDYDGDYPINLGNVRLSANYVEFDDVNKGDQPMAELQLVNTSSVPYSPQLMHLPAYLSAEYIPAKVQPGRVGKIRLRLNSDQLFLDGLNQTSLYLARKLGDKISEANEIVVSAILLPARIDRTAEQMAHAPHIVIKENETVIDGDIAMQLNGKKHASVQLSVTNTGEEKLTISALQVFNRAVSVTLSERHIEPHATAKMRITVDAKMLSKAKNGPKLLIISNDPRSPKTVININID